MFEEVSKNRRFGYARVSSYHNLQGSERGIKLRTIQSISQTGANK